MNDLRACWYRATLRQRNAKVTIEWCYHGGNRSETSSGPGMWLSDVVEEGRVEYVSVTSLALGPPGLSMIHYSPRKMKKKISQSSVKLSWNLEIASNAIKTILGRETQFCIRFHSTGFTPVVSPKWAGLKCRRHFPDGISIRTIYSNSIFVIFLAFSAFLDYLLYCLYLKFSHIVFSQISRSKMRWIRPVYKKKSWILF